MSCDYTSVWLLSSSSSAGGAGGGGGCTVPVVASVVVSDDRPLPIIQAPTATSTTTATTAIHIALLEESSEVLDESPLDAGWVVSGAFVVVAASAVVVVSGASPPGSSPDEAVVVTRLPPGSPSSLHPTAKTAIAIASSATATGLPSRFIRSVSHFVGVFRRCRPISLVRRRIRTSIGTHRGGSPADCHPPATVSSVMISPSPRRSWPEGAVSGQGLSHRRPEIVEERRVNDYSPL